MDVGKFKSSRIKLTCWILIPLLLVVGAGLSSFALRLQSEWKLHRTEALAKVLPRLIKAQNEVRQLVVKFRGDAAERVQTADELISFLQNTALAADFTVDSLKVDRRAAAEGRLPILVANVKGTGTFLALETYLGDVSSKQHLLTESFLKISQAGRGQDQGDCRAEITFELVLFKPLSPGSNGEA